MKLVIYAALVVAPLAALAGQPLRADLVANMKAQAQAVMDGGLCAVANDTRDYGTETRAIRLQDGTFRRVRTNTYNALRATGYTRNAVSGQWRMVEQVDTCSVDAESETCLVVRSLWKQVPVEVSPPGPGVALR